MRGEYSASFLFPEHQLYEQKRGWKSMGALPNPPLLHYKQAAILEV
jgi:hypothetical protein